MRRIRNKHTFNECLNCEKPLTTEANFCENCGQKRITGRISFWSIVREFFDATFSLDARLLKSIMVLFVPGKLTQEYFAGHHVRYWQPLRLFLFLAVLQIGVISVFMSKLNEKIAEGNDSLKENLASYMVMSKLDSLKPKVAKIFPNHKIAQNVIDTLLTAYYKPEMVDEKVQHWRDSIRAVVIEKLTQDSIGITPEAIEEGMEKASRIRDKGFIYSVVAKDKDSLEIPSMGLNPSQEDNNVTTKEMKVRVRTKELKIHKLDFYKLSPDDIINKYGVEGFWNRLFTKQILKTMKDGRSGIEFFTSKLSWMLILLMPFLALFLELMNRKFYYVEHLIFSFHCHCMVFFSFSAVAFSDIWMKQNGDFFSKISGFLILFLLIYFFLALKNVYQQGWIRTFIKFLFLVFAYTITILIFFLITAIASFMFY
jgi:Protein of unknown function (DUF3667)